MLKWPPAPYILGTIATLLALENVTTGLAGTAHVCLLLFSVGVMVYQLRRWVTRTGLGPLL